MKHCLRRYSKIILFISLGLQITIQAQNAQDAITKLQNSFKSIKTFEAAFNQLLINSAGETVFSLSGKMFFEQPEKFNIDLGDKAIISDGIDVYNVDENLGRVVVSSASDRTNSFSLQKFILEFPDLCTHKLLKGSNGNNEIELTPKGEIGFKKVNLKTNDATFISEIRILDNASNQIIFKLSDYKLNIKIEPEIFKYNSQQGLEIIDLR